MFPMSCIRECAFSKIGQDSMDQEFSKNILYSIFLLCPFGMKYDERGTRFEYVSAGQ